MTRVYRNNRSFYVFLFALLANAFALAPGAQAQQEATEADPEHYSVDFENDHVRVVRVTYGPGEKSVMHTHLPALVVCLTDGKMRMTYPDGTTEESECIADQVGWNSAVTHLPENLSEPMEVLLVELK